jgi:putative molybdopterin biosynthesis protein
MELLTSAETADYLRLKERKLYELVATGAVPCTKVTGRWLFPKAELDRWIAAALAQPVGLMPAEPPRIIGGSHDPLLEWALRESGSALATLPEGSERGLERFLAGEVVAAAIHLHTLEGTGTDANVEAVRRSVQTHDAVLIAFVRREQGFVVAHGNPLDLSAIADVVERRARLALRPVCPTGPDIAQAIRAGHADCGIATRSVANAAGLGFVPIMWEDFDLLLHQRDYFRAPMQAFFRFLSSSEFKARAQEAGGYDVSRGGQVRFAP